jgi:hypothetical protein
VTDTRLSRAVGLLALRPYCAWLSCLHQKPKFSVQNSIIWNGSTCLVDITNVVVSISVHVVTTTFSWLSSVYSEATSCPPQEISPTFNCNWTRLQWGGNWGHLCRGEMLRDGLHVHLPSKDENTLHTMALLLVSIKDPTFSRQSAHRWR